MLAYGGYSREELKDKTLNQLRDMPMRKEGKKDSVTGHITSDEKETDIFEDIDKDMELIIIKLKNIFWYVLNERT